MRKVIYPGTFDPMTNGHLDIITRASKVFDEVVVVIMNNPRKHCSISAEKRLEMINKCVCNFPNVTTAIGEGLTIDFARKMGCNAIVRGIRAVTDYEYELALATGNMTLNPDIETILMVSKPELSFLSSSIVKEVASFGGDISKFIPDKILSDVERELVHE